MSNSKVYAPDWMFAVDKLRAKDFTNTFSYVDYLHGKLSDFVNISDEWKYQINNFIHDNFLLYSDISSVRQKLIEITWDYYDSDFDLIEAVVSTIWNLYIIHILRFDNNAEMFYFIRMPKDFPKVNRPDEIRKFFPTVWHYKKTLFGTKNIDVTEECILKMIPHINQYGQLVSKLLIDYLDYLERNNFITRPNTNNG